MESETTLLVVDASVAVKWFVSDSEDSMREAADLLERHAENEVRLVAPSLLVHELMHVLRRRGADLAEAADTFFDMDVLLVTSDRALTVGATRLITELGLSTFDAPYAALADSLDCALATADRRLAKALVGRLQVKVL